MTRIAAALLIVAAVLAINGGLVSRGLAAELQVRRPAPAVEISQPIAVRSAKVLSLLLVLEALRQAPSDISLQRS